MIVLKVRARGSRREKGYTVTVRGRAQELAGVSARGAREENRYTGTVSGRVGNLHPQSTTPDPARIVYLFATRRFDNRVFQAF